MVVAVTINASLCQSRYTAPLPLAAVVAAAATTRSITARAAQPSPQPSLANRLSILTRKLNTNYCSNVSNYLPHTPTDPDRTLDRANPNYTAKVCRLNYNVFHSCLASQLTMMSSQSSNESVLCRHLGDVQRLTEVLRDVQGTITRSIGSRCQNSPHPPSPIINAIDRSIPRADCSLLCQRQSQQTTDDKEEFGNRLIEILRSAASLTLNLRQATSWKCSLPAFNATTPSVNSNLVLSNVVVLEYADQLTEAIANALQQFQG
jgi:hypothetical protein